MDHVDNQNPVDRVEKIMHIIAGKWRPGIIYALVMNGPLRSVVVLVQVGGDDLALAVLARERLGHPDGLDDLLELPFEGSVGILDESRVEQPGPNELLRDGRRPARDRYDKKTAPR